MTKIEKNRKKSNQILTVCTFEQFKELYFPSISASKKKKIDENENNYGDMIAMSILDGIKKDLSILSK
jgi:hypothetical protein